MSLINPASANMFNAMIMSAFVWVCAMSRCATPTGMASPADTIDDWPDDDIDANTISHANQIGNLCANTTQPK